MLINNKVTGVFLNPSNHPSLSFYHCATYFIQNIQATHYLQNMETYLRKVSTNQKLLGIPKK